MGECAEVIRSVVQSPVQEERGAALTVCRYDNGGACVEVGWRAGAGATRDSTKSFGTAGAITVEGRLEAPRIPILGSAGASARWNTKPPVVPMSHLRL